MAPRHRIRWLLGSVVALMVVAGLAAGGTGPAPDAAQVRRDLVVNASRFRFEPARIDAAVGDVVKVTLVAEDIPHSFTIDDYRISKRAAPGTPVTFEFHAARAGTFDFYCNLALDDGCRKMKGQLVVAAPSLSPTAGPDESRR